MYPPNKAIVVAEIGINHNANFDILCKLTDMAFYAGADFVKLQLRTPELCVPEKYWDKPKMWFNGDIIPYIEYRKRMELPFFGDERTLEDYDAYVKEWWGKMRWTASVWDIPSLERLTKFKVPFIKIPSAMLTNNELLRAAKKTRIPVVLSTGMSTIDEIEAAVDILGMYDLTLLHCNSAYPTPDVEVNLRGMDTLANLFGVIINDDLIQVPNYKIGFSSHSKSPYPTIYSIVYGAQMVEVHITLDRAMHGGDHAASLERRGLELVTRERDRIALIMGDGQLKVYDSELSAKEKLRGA